jgi:hypothetical protein
VFCVSTDELLGRSRRLVMDVSGLSDTQIAHLEALAEDLRRR